MNYQKAKDGKGNPIRGLWKRGANWLARLNIDGRPKWVRLAPKENTVSAARDELKRLTIERTDGAMRHIGRSPTFAAYVQNTYLPRLATCGKKPGTILAERGHVAAWVKAIGALALDKVKPAHIAAQLHAMRARGLAASTHNTALVFIRNVMKSAKLDGYLNALPFDGVHWQRVPKTSRALFSPADVQSVIETARAHCRNGQQAADYLRLLSLCGAREQETVKLPWSAVDFDRLILTIAPDGDSKARKPRAVNMSPELAAHLREMFNRREPESPWLFPSRNGQGETHARTLRASLNVARAKLPARFAAFGFHDLRHFFVSHAVMSGIDFLTIARWVGHADGGVLIGRIYGHISDTHAQAAAQRLQFKTPAPVLLPAPAACALV